ncbi:MAG TPA: twin-arginine translocase TatA/TatE family subunit [Anaeromyxobacteraceae bacterium]|nr:twin-arginine translocase TatA/TatE family subunit [Anaeromyxobacteraceae bacterium]
MGLGLPEVLVILVVLLLVFGANKIPQLGDAVGKCIRNFKKASASDDSIDVTPKEREQARLPPSGQQSAASPPTAEKKV